MSEEASTPTVEELQAQIAELTPQLESLTGEKTALLAKNAELLGETKLAKKARLEAEGIASAAAEDKAKASGDFEQLHRSSEAARNDLQKQLDDVMGSVATEKRDNAALKAAGELAEGSNAEILADIMARRLKWTEDGLKVTNASGELTVSTLEDLKKEFEGDPRYASLLKGSQASGGSATGGDKGGGAAKQIGRTEFNALNPVDQMKFVKEGGAVSNQL